MKCIGSEKPFGSPTVLYFVRTGQQEWWQKEVIHLRHNFIIFVSSPSSAVNNYSMGKVTPAMASNQERIVQLYIKYCRMVWDKWMLSWVKDSFETPKLITFNSTKLSKLQSFKLFQQQSKWNILSWSVSRYYPTQRLRTFPLPFFVFVTCIYACGSQHGMTLTFLSITFGKVRWRRWIQFHWSQHFMLIYD